MARTFGQVASYSPSRNADSYVYAIAPTQSNGLAAITSADELLLLDRQDLEKSPVVYFEGVPKGVTCMSTAGSHETSLVCAGRDGVVAIFDMRTQKRLSTFKQDRPLTALTCSRTEIATGTELANHQAVISVWDRRQNKIRWQNAENNDDITDLNFHPWKANRLLSGGVDGLVSIFDTTIHEEDDSLSQVVNHGPVHKAGFLDETTIYALSSDEHLSLHPVSSDDDKDDPEPVVFGDLRALLDCEYAIDIGPIGLEGYLAVGSHSSSPRIELRSIKNGKLDKNSEIALTGAHGEEVVRSLFADVESGTIFTAGEDGQIRAFRSSSGQPPSPAASKPKKVSKTTDVRYNPY